MYEGFPGLVTSSDMAAVVAGLDWDEITHLRRESSSPRPKKILVGVADHLQGSGNYRTKYLVTGLQVSSDATR